MLWVIALIAAVGLGWLAPTIIKFNLERRAVQAVVASLSASQIDEIIRLVESLGTAPSKGFVGIIHNAPEPSGNFTLRLPEELPGYPWAAMVVDVTAAPKKSPSPVEFKVRDRNSQNSGCEPLQIRWLAIPTVEVGKAGTKQSVYSADRYMRLSPALSSLLSSLHPKSPKALLNQIMSGHIESKEPFDQLRAGLPAAWIQAPRFHKCPECRRPMRLILQVPGTLLTSRLSEGSFYWLGCPSDPAQTITDADWG